jgi:hypothetical protein
MPYTPELVHELNTLIRFDPDSGQQGIKVHKNADEDIKAAARRLHVKGLITQGRRLLPVIALGYTIPLAGRRWIQADSGKRPACQRSGKSPRLSPFPMRE